jgi:DNA-binding MarR family transcriptional regulator
MIKLDRTLTYRLHLLHKLTDIESQRAYVAGAGLSMSDGRCLTAVGSFAPLSVKDLAQKANLNKAQASRAAQSLVDQGLVLKTASPTDGRGVVLTLTPLGKAAWQRAMDVVGQRNKDIFGALSPAELRQLSDFFDRLIDDARSCGDLAEAAEDQVSGETT